jgi:hypothetical protein
MILYIGLAMAALVLIPLLISCAVAEYAKRHAWRYVTVPAFLAVWILTPLTLVPLFDGYSLSSPLGIAKTITMLATFAVPLAVGAIVFWTISNTRSFYRVLVTVLAALAVAIVVGPVVWIGVWCSFRLGCP